MTRKHKMSPWTMARTECANLEPDGWCLGIRHEDLTDRGQKKCAAPLDSCLVREGKRCRYFEHCILPLADDPSPKDDPGLQAKRQSARDSYLGKHVLKPIKPKLACPDCGEPRAPRHKYCEYCAAKHRKLAARGRKRKQRELG